MTGFHLERAAFDPFAAVRPVVTSSELPTRIGPAEFSALGALVAVHCPSDLAPLMRRPLGSWQPALTDRVATDSGR